MTFTEVGDRVWVARYEWFDANVSVVAGERGLVVVDTHASTAAGRRVLDDVRHLGAGDVVAVVNTHAHLDHCFGNAAFREADPAVPVHAHEQALAELRDFADSGRQATYAGEPADPRDEEVRSTEIVLPDHTFSSAAVLDLGDRVLELVHPGPAHTSGDLVVLVPDARVLIAGDLVEESAPPAFGPDSFPMQWPLSLDIVLGLTTGASTVVPGHGAVVDREFVEVQRNELGIVAETIRDLAGRGVPVDEALAAGTWPWEERYLATAVRLGYEHLPRSQKRLPLI
ncbi:Beta-lactamase 2 precursor [Nocardioides dokdonensis FR1436]|uniref:Beta-lactamase 2 n=1 Tax=Nocardioides dokdonensis FR1436 TaxID=1300347 RepID=A0A1A9GPH7_9ACTN|nr:MBL fold metallo-hydrolase [Nocardioides dokdonensis]ANH40204.1 Beta-lactamase 2 precursor [Nocardioides dokdonensis FR1436]